MKKLLIGISIAINLLLLTVVAWVWLGGARGLILEYFIEPSHTRWVSQFETLPVQPGDVVFLGDSITEGGAWHELFPQSQVRNRGIGGDTTTGVLARLGQVTAGKPAQVFLMIGTNDLAMGTPISQIAANIGEIVDQIRIASPETAIFVQTVLPRAADYRSDVETLNAEILATIGGKANWVDLYPEFLSPGDGSIEDALSNDELHLMGEGYLLWRDTLKPLVIQRSLRYHRRF
jgi:lysophospholipase L1-like esterase